MPEFDSLDWCGWMPEPPEEAPDPYDRPDLFWRMEESETDPCTALQEGEYRPCPCCGAEVIPEETADCVCPVCGWDCAETEGLAEARLNFQTFGTIDPLLQWDRDIERMNGETDNDAEL